MLLLPPFRPLALTLLLVTLYIGAGAQLQAAFTASKTGGCSPLVVTFTNATTGAGASATYQWDLGNGNRSTDKNPSAIYTDEKSYTVTLTVKDGALTSTKTQMVTVYKKPTLNVTTDITKGCAPLTATLTATVSPGDGTTQSWFWDYGDGQTDAAGTTPTVKHTYTFANKATVSLTVMNSYGCQATVIKDTLINVLPTLEASFTTPQTFICRVTDPVTFTNTSKGPGTLSYQWSFGDNTTSAQPSPSHVYGSKGSYNVSLTVNSSEGCTATKALPTSLNVADYQSAIVSPALYCTGKETKFFSQSTPSAFTTEWNVDNYGSGYTYGTGTVSYYFYNAGAYRLRMINTFGACKDTVYKDFVINKSPALNGFVATKSTECGAPATVSFRDTTTGNVRWKWNYNCNYSCPTADDTIQAPTHAFQYPNPYYVQLEAFNAAGCSSTILQMVDLQKPQMFMLVSSNSQYNSTHGCIGLTVTFQASRPADIAQYKWTFSDDGSVSTSATPTHVFNKAGIFKATLDYVLKNGCTGTISSEDFYVRGKPVFNFSTLPNPIVCGNTPVKFTGTANESQDWYWYFGDGQTAYNYSGYTNTVEHKYETEGTYTVMLVAQAAGCFDTVIKKDYLVVKPPFPKINNPVYTCDGTRGEVTFRDGSRQVQSWSWDFGDNTAPVSYTTAPPDVKHMYTRSGVYKVVLSTTNGTCTVKDSTTVKVLLKQNPVLAATQTTLCSDQWLETSITNLDRNWAAYYDWAQYGTYTFQYGDGRTAAVWPLSMTGYDPGPDMKFKIQQFERGPNQFRVILRSDYYNCFDTSNFISINIKGPVAGFSATPSYCSGNSMTFTDTSRGTGGVPIVSRTWNFGDGASATYTAPGPITHQYANAYSYDITLKVTDADGCTDQKYVPYLRVGGVKAAFSASATTISPNSTVSFTNTSFDNYTYSTTYRWVFGDGVTSTQYSPQHTYTQPGTYTVMLLATNSTYGCTDTARQVIVVKYINSAFSFTSSYLNNASCPPVVVRFTNKSTNAARVVWDFGDGARSEGVFNPAHLYTKPGSYIITLQAYSDNGTEYTTIDSVTIKPGASASLSSDKLMACTPGAVTLFAPGDKGSSYLWDFGNGTVRQTTDSFSVYTFSAAGVYAPTLVLTDTSGCVVSAKLAGNIVIDSLQIDIGPIPSACNNAQIAFQPVVTSVAASQGQGTLSYSWNFGTGNAADTSNLKTPTFSYGQPGTYTVAFQVVSPSGCFKQTTKGVVVDQKIRGTITGPADICEGTTTQFSATAPSSSVTWAWSFGQGGTATQQAPSAQLFATPGTYPVTLVVKNGACVDTTYHQLEVHPKPTVTLAQRQLLLCTGSTVQLSATGATTYSWQPATGLSDPNSANPVASPATTTKYSLVALSAFGCKATDSVTVTVAPPMVLQLSPGVSICPGQRVQLTASGASSYQWIGVTNGLSSTAIPNPLAAPLTTTTYAVRGTDAYNCFADTARVTVTVGTLPTVNAGPDVVLSGGGSYTFNPVYSPDVTNWAWTPATDLSCAGCAAPVATPSGDREYIITVKNDVGCAAADTVRITTRCGESHIYIPNAFTPNGDSRNPVFAIRGSGVKLVTSLTIFNRWGERVFEKKNFLPGDRAAAWDGRQGGNPVPAGSYVYFATFQCASGDTFTKKGTVTVIY